MRRAVSGLFRISRFPGRLRLRLAEGQLQNVDVEIRAYLERIFRVFGRVPNAREIGDAVIFPVAETLNEFAMTKL